MKLEVQARFKDKFSQYQSTRKFEHDLRKILLDMTLN
jgi:hypothetical protein